MSTLKHEPNLARPDDVYNLIVDAHKGLTPEQSERLNAALVLLLANHVGDEDVIREAVAAARRSVSA
ncbi:MAG: DUF2783 domain-containing protein [Reyranellaceae bacterium]